MVQPAERAGSLCAGLERPGEGCISGSCREKKLPFSMAVADGGRTNGQSLCSGRGESCHPWRFTWANASKNATVQAELTRLVRTDPSGDRRARSPALPPRRKARCGVSARTEGKFLKASDTANIMLICAVASVWAAVPPVTALVYFQPQYGNHPLVLQYAMRVLEQHPVDLTFFFVPKWCRRFGRTVSVCRASSLVYGRVSDSSRLRRAIHFRDVQDLAAVLPPDYLET